MHPHRLLHLAIAEGREGQERDPGREAHAPGKARGLDRDVGQLLAVGQLVHLGIGDEQRAAARQHHGRTHQPLAALLVDHPADVVERGHVVAGEARDHGVGIAQRHHAGAEHVAVEIDQALAVAEQEAAPLVAAIEQLGVGAVAGRDPGVDDLQPVGQLDAQRLGGLRHPLLAADQDRRAHAVVQPGDRGPDRGPFLAFREHHPLGLGAHPVDDQLHAGSARIQPGAQLGDIALLVQDRLLRHPGRHGGARHGRRHRGDQARIERGRDQVVLAVAQAQAAIGDADLVRHLGARQVRDRMGGGDLHLVIDAGRAHVQGAAEDVGEAQHVVDLVRIVRAAGRHDRVGPDLLDLLGRDLGIGIGHREHDRLGRHALDHLGRERPLGRQAEHHVGAGDRIRQRAGIGLDRMGRLPLVHADRAAAIDHALGVAQDRVLGRQAHRLQELQAGDRGGAGAVDHQPDVLDRAAGHVERVQEPGGGDDRGAMLVVMEHRDVHQLAQPLLDHEALGRLDVLEVDAAEGRPEQAHAIDELVDVLGADLEVDAVDVGEALEQDRLAFHHRLGAKRAQIAEAEHGGAVRDHRHQIALGGVVEGLGRIGLDRQARRRHAWRIGEREVALGGQRLGRRDLDLAGPAAPMQLERLLVGDTDPAWPGFTGIAAIDHRMIPSTPPRRLPAVPPVNLSERGFRLQPNP